MIDDFKQAIIELQDRRTGGRINAEDITEMAREKFGAVYKERSIYSVLSRIDMVWVSARSVHPNRDIVQQNIFKKTS